MKVEVNQQSAFKDTFASKNIVCNDKGTIIIVTYPNGEEQFAGFAIKLSEQESHFDPYQNSWRKKDFSLFTGSITIYNRLTNPLKF